MSIDVAQLRKQLSDSDNRIDYHEAERIRKQLHQHALQNYEPKHDAKTYFDFMNENECSFDINSPGDTNDPYYFCLFTEVSQHVSGDCVEECLDKAIALHNAEEEVEDDDE
jgi:hypothetical protein